MTERIECIKPGARVKLGGTIEAVVTAVTIRAQGVSGYEVTWWDGNARHAAWVEPFEVAACEEAPRPLRVGFGQGVTS